MLVPGQWHDIRIDPNSKRRKICTNRVSNVARGEMGIMFFSHASISMAELRGDDAHWHAAHGKRRTVRMAEYVEADGGGNPGTGARLGKRPLLVRGSPRLAIAAVEYVRFACAAGCKSPTRRDALFPPLTRAPSLYPHRRYSLPRAVR
jgi:hypothetical protein